MFPQKVSARVMEPHVLALRAMGRAAADGPGSVPPVQATQLQSCPSGPCARRASTAYALLFAPTGDLIERTQAQGPPSRKQTGRHRTQTLKIDAFQRSVKGDLKKKIPSFTFSAFSPTIIFITRNFPVNLISSGCGIRSQVLKNCGKQSDVCLFKHFGGAGWSCYGDGEVCSLRRVDPSGTTRSLSQAGPSYAPQSFSLDVETIIQRIMIPSFFPPDHHLASVSGQYTMGTCPHAHCPPCPLAPPRWAPRSQPERAAGCTASSLYRGWN